MASLPKKLAPLSLLPSAVLTGSLVPFAVLLYRGATHRLGANPIATALNQLGLLALVFLLASLACTPLQIAFKVNWPIRIRKTLGLLAFFTAAIHFLVYLALDQGFALSRIFVDISKRPFIGVGFAALVLLLPLALTSTKRAQQRLGFAQWKRLHRIVYVAGILGCSHFFLRVKASTREPAIYVWVLALLLSTRVAAWGRSRWIHGARASRAAR